MNAELGMKRLAFFLIFATLSFIVSIIVSPALFNLAESVSGTPLFYEGALRIVIAATGGILLFAAVVWLLARGTRQQWIVWLVQCASYVSLLTIFLSDSAHLLREEFSWIRYTTSGFLLAASITCVALTLAYRKEQKRALAFFWFLIAAAFLYAGVDEVYEVHEAIGRWLENTFRLSHVVSDLVTVGYAIIALGMIVLFYRVFLPEYRERHSLFLRVFVVGGVVYFFSTMFDTLDVVIGNKLRSFANVLAVNPGFVFLDAWYVVWSPKDFFNGWEEVFEHVAASLFFTAPLSLVVLPLSKGELEGVRFLVSRRRIAGALAAFLTVVFGILIFLSLPHVRVQSPVMQGSSQKIAGYFDGLFHTDDLFYHPSWGVLVANEGKGNVYQWNNGRWGMVPDAERQLRDTDSVTADDRFIYVADGSQGTIFRSDGKGIWEALWTREDGLKHPEAIVVVDGVLYALDESEKSVTTLVSGGKPVVWKPSHPLWRAPEGIAYDAIHREFIVTDDESGAVFSVDVEKQKLNLLAQLSKPEDVVVTPDGRMIVSDNGWGAVFAVTRDGHTEKIAQFRRAYRDLQGITMDDAGTLFVVTADGSASTSFMPSFLFAIPNPPPF